jgi:hypothetical protein
MSRSRRSSNKNRSGNGANNNGGNGNRGGNGSGTRGANGANAGSGSRDFWGTRLRLDDVDQTVIESPDPTAMVRSLGIPPLAGNRPISEHYFAAVYGKAAGLAHALLAAEQPVAERDTDDIS